MKKIQLSFFARKDVVLIARDLIGKIITTRFDGKVTSARIVETEAYAGITDKASHAFGGRRTARNEPMYSSPGTIYVYLCYGLHQMLNIVTNKPGVPDAVLIRAVEPIEGIDIMLKRTAKKTHDATLTRGPGNVAKALGISRLHSGHNFFGNEIYLSDDHFALAEEAIGMSARIGIESAGADALLPYRFYIKGNKYVSGRNK